MPLQIRCNFVKFYKIACTFVNLIDAMPTVEKIELKSKLKDDVVTSNTKILIIELPGN